MEFPDMRVSARNEAEALEGFIKAMKAKVDELRALGLAEMPAMSARIYEGVTSEATIAHVQILDLDSEFGY